MMKRKGQAGLRIILLHLLFWTGVWFFYVYFFSYNSDDKSYVIWFSSLLLPLTMAVTYFAIYFLIPKFLLEKKYGRFFLYSFYVLVFSSYMIVLIIYGCLIFLMKFDATIIPPMIKNFLSILILVYLVVGIISSITILNTKFRVDRENRDLQNKILKTQLQIKEQEIQYLKMQLHPHFLFNTLNTIYGMALKQSRHTPEVILKLSNLLDYILYQVDSPGVSLKEEVEHIKEYIELEKIRFRESLEVHIEMEEPGDDRQVAPMLLIPFVENAFKHGSIVNGILEVFIELKVAGDVMSFSIRNTVMENSLKNAGTGIGLDNLRKRLELHYPENYDLVNEIKDGWYYVNLTVKHINPT